MAQLFFGNDGSANGSWVAANAKAARDAFVAAMASYATETLESGTTSIPTSFASARNVFGSSGKIWQPLPGGGLGNFVTGGNIESFAGFGRFNTTPGGGGVVGAGRWVDTDWHVRIRMTSFVTAFGMYVTDAGDFGASLVVKLMNSTTDTTVVANAFRQLNGDALVPSGGNGSLLFFGYVSDAAFDEVRIEITQLPSGNGLDFDSLGYDDLMVGTASAEPPPPPPPAPAPAPAVLCQVWPAGIPQ